MSRGGIGFEGIGTRQATFVAGGDLKALVDEVGKDKVKGVPVVISGSGEVDLGSDGDTVFGVIDVYENDDHVGVIFRGFATGVPVGTTPPTIGKIASVNGDGGVKDSSSTAKARAPIFVEVGTDTATVFLG